MCDNVCLGRWIIRHRYVADNTEEIATLKGMVDLRYFSDVNGVLLEVQVLPNMEAPVGQVVSLLYGNQNSIEDLVNIRVDLGSSDVFRRFSLACFDMTELTDYTHIYTKAENFTVPFTAFFHIMLFRAHSDAIIIT